MSEGIRDFDPSAYGYRAFISYSRRDSEFVDDLYKRLTRYRAPRSLQGKDAKFGPPPKSLRVFLDRMSIEAGGTVPEGIKQKLRDSAFLIVVCSKSAIDSFWVNEEVRFFLSIASPDRILPILIRETADAPIEEIMPKPLLELEGATPMGADLLLDGGMVSVRDKIIGGLIGLAQDRVARAQELADRRALRRRSLALASITILFVLSSLAGMAAWTARNDALLAESRSLARASTEATVEQWRPDLGMLLALQALPRRASQWLPIDRPYEPQAAVALASSVFWQSHRQVIGEVSSDIVYRSPSISIAPDGARWLFAYDRTVEVWDSATETRLSIFELDAALGTIKSARFSAIDDTIAIVMEPTHYLFVSAVTGDIIAQGETTPSAYGEVAMSPTAAEAVIYRGGGDFWLVDTQTGATKQVLKGHTRHIQDVLFGPNGDQILSLAEDRSIRLWDVSTGAEISRLTTDEHMGFRDLLWSRDGQTAITTTDRAIQRWDLSNEQITHQENRARNGSRYGTIAGSKDGKLFALSDGDGISIRSATDLTELQRLDGHREEVAHLTFSANGQLLASTGQDFTARIWSVRTGREIARFVHPNRPFGEIAFTEHGVVAAGRDTAAYYWRLPPAAPIRTLSGHENAVQSVSFNADGTRLVSASADFTVKVWDADAGELMVPFGGDHSHGWIVLGAMFDPSGDKVLSFGEDDNAIIWDAETGEQIWGIGAEGTMRGGVFSPDGTYVALASADNSIGLLSAETGDVLFQADAHEGGARGAVFAPTRAEFMTHGSDGKIRIWDIETQSERLTINAFGLSVFTAAYSPDGRYIVGGTGGGGQGQATVFDALTGDVVAQLYPHNGAVRQAIFTADGGRVLTASADGYARLWDIESEAVVTSVSSNQRDLSDVDISPDGQRFVTVAYVSDGPSAVLWDLETGQRIADYYGQETTVLDVEFAPQRADQPMRFATAGIAGTIEIWEAPRAVQPDALIDRACAILQTTNRELTAQEALQFGLGWPVPNPC